MIPKIIHYCWFGEREKPKLVKRCIESWRVHCPDYKLIEWNENNVDINEYPYLRWCFENKKWAYLSDFVRLLVVEKYGGIYLDTDVEIVKKFDYLLEYEAFYGYENSNYVATGLGFGAVKGHITLEAMKNEYSNIVPDKNGNIVPIGCPILNTKALTTLGLTPNGAKTRLYGAIILPPEYMNPYDDCTGKLNVTDNTISIHWYAKSALSKYSIIRSNITRPLHRMFGVNCFSRFKKNS